MKPVVRKSNRREYHPRSVATADTQVTALVLHLALPEESTEEQASFESSLELVDGPPKFEVLDDQTPPAEATDGAPSLEALDEGLAVVPSTDGENESQADPADVASQETASSET